MVTIRKFCTADVSPLYEAVQQSVPELKPWLLWCDGRFSLRDSRDFVLSREQAWQRGEQYNFAITESNTGKLLGSVALNFINRRLRQASLGYWVRTGATQLGVATEAVRLCARFGREQLGLDQINIFTARDNVASCRVAEKAGARQKGVFSQAVLVNEKPVDGVLYTLLREDLEATIGCSSLQGSGFSDHFCGV